MKIVSMVCPNCGASLQVDADQKNLTCNYCGNSLYVDDEVKHVQYDNAEETGYQFEKGRQRAQAEAFGVNQQTARMNPGQPPKKRKTWLWVLGWICIFPVPLTILMVRNQKLSKPVKIGIIAAAWIVYLLIAFSGGGSGDNKDTSNVNTETTTVEQTTDDSAIDTGSATEDVTTEGDTAEEKLSLSDITYVELDELQKLFIDIPTFAGKEEINAFIKENGFYSHEFTGAKEYYVGLTSASISTRGRDREGEMIHLSYNDDGSVSKVGYTIGGSVGFFDNYELTYTGDKFHYDGEDYDDGEAAMQLYLANSGVGTVETSNDVSESAIDKFIADINKSEDINLEFVEDFIPSDKESGHYRTEFRLNAWKDSTGKSYKYGDTTVDIILSSSGEIQRIYMDGSTLEQCESMIRYASPLLDSTVGDSDIQEAIDYVDEHKEANGYYYGKLGLLVLGHGDRGYEFMLKLS